MKLQTILIALLVLGYFAWEVSNLHKQRYRMEPLFVHNEFVTANHATERCGNPDEGERSDFLRNFRAVTRNALNDLREKQPNASDLTLETELATLRRAREAEVDTFIESHGCAHQTVWRWVKLHDVRANLNLR